MHVRDKKVPINPSLHGVDPCEIKRYQVGYIIANIGEGCPWPRRHFVLRTVEILDAGREQLIMNGTRQRSLLPACPSCPTGNLVIKNAEHHRLRNDFECNLEVARIHSGCHREYCPAAVPIKCGLAPIPPAYSPGRPFADDRFPYQGRSVFFSGSSADMVYHRCTVWRSVGQAGRGSGAIPWLCAFDTQYRRLMPSGCVAG